MTYTLLPPRADAPRNQYVYFMYSAGRVKIGYSGGAEGRLKTMRSYGAFPPVLILVMPGTMGEEQDLHVRFSADRIHGEWFRLSPELRKYLMRRLCDIGRATLDASELAYRDACKAFLADFKEPPKRAKRQHCQHGMPFGSICHPCERERDLSVLDSIKSGTFAA